MTQKEIHDKLDEMLSNPKTKNFLTHLIKAYFPMSNVEKVWEKPQGPFKCVITNDNLVCVLDIFGKMRTEEFERDYMEHLKTMFTENKIESPVAKLIGDKKMGVVGKDTTTFMSLPVYFEFHSWLATKILNGDKHINWITKPTHKKPQPKKEEEKPASSFTLGELDSFKKLYAKFK
jgi:hypothetical protein